MHRLPIALIGLVSAAVLGTVLAATHVATANTAVYNTNLVVNGDAEMGVALPDKGPMPGWQTTGEFSQAHYGYDDYPNNTDPGPPSRGKSLFVGGLADALSTATQTIDLGALGTDIDGGSVHFAFSAYIGGYAGQKDDATVSATFVGSDRAKLKTVILGPVTEEQRNGKTSLLSRSSEGSVPKGSRSVQIVMVATRSEGSANDGYVDNVSLVLSKP
jgi:hypothetical protein